MRDDVGFRSSTQPTGSGDRTTRAAIALQDQAITLPDLL